MAASLAHEIRNPLAALEVSTTLLQRKLGEKSPAAGLVETLQDQVRRLSGTANDCLEYVRPLELNRSPVDLTALLDEVLAAAAVEEHSPRLKVVREYPPEAVVVSADMERLRQTFLNLVRNASEAIGGESGVLKLTVESSVPGPVPAAGRFARVRVYDSGPGIPEDIRERVFNPFFSTKPKGSGLGLPWARKVVDAHGGVLDVESEPGQWTAFTVRLPLPTAAVSPELIVTGDAIHEAQDSDCRG
jgi:two-component system nitrogen regulation sensor histidine kinase GlnL